jgi:coenzyme F420 hydrogenase subunit beta
VKLPLASITDVAERQLCCGCGACAALAPRAIRMVDALDYGRRPIVCADADAAELADALRVCPGIELTRELAPGSDLIRELYAAWGPIRDVWEGHAGDEELRYHGSSGAAASALSLFCLEQRGAYGVLHIAAQPDAPFLNRTVLSTTRAELLAATGSRYAPASPCDGLQLIVDAPGPCVFVGKPCDVAAVAKARRLRPELDRRLALTVSIFCAATPSTRGTLELLTKLGVDDPANVIEVRYRGRGWPGRFEVAFRTPAGVERRSTTYEAAWDHLQRYRQWRCNLCPDHTGEFADVSVGDPWYRSRGENEIGHSLVIARSPRGREIVEQARAAGALQLSRVSPDVFRGLSPYQPRVLGMLWGRLAGLRLTGAPRPRFRGLPLARHWWSALGIMPKIQSVLGTVKRAWLRRLHARHSVVEADWSVSDRARRRPPPALSPAAATGDE